MRIQILVISLLALCGISASAFENYFRPGTVWTIEVCNYADPAPYIAYNEILDEITFEGEKVLPFVEYSQENPEPELQIYLRTEGDKVYWRSTYPEYPDWYLLYDFGLQVGDETVVYSLRKKKGNKVIPVSIKCLRYDYYNNEYPLIGPLMRIQVLKYDDQDHSSDVDFQGDWIIGIGHLGGPGNILKPFLWGWGGGGTYTLCVESPKGNVVYGDPTAAIKTVSVSSQPEVKTGVFNMQGIRVADSTENLPAGLYIVDGKKVAITK